MSTTQEILREKRRQAHHLWNAERADGKVTIKRTKAEKDAWDVDGEKKASRMTKEASMNKEAARVAAQAMWGVFGASLVDDPSLTSEIPKSVVARFNERAGSVEAIKLKSWDELRTEYGDSVVSEARVAIADGMRCRMFGKEANLPLMVAKDVLDALPGVDLSHLKSMVDGVRVGKVAEVVRTYGEDGKKVAVIYKEAVKTGSHKIAVDSAAKSLIEEYFGPYGKELTKSIQKRVRADLAARWLRRNGCDQSAADVWASYLGEYGSYWTHYVPKLLRPAK